ncbi:hypothetical protein GQ457_10G016490 [Hibiscus cannabinus]
MDFTRLPQKIRLSEENGWFEILRKKKIGVFKQPNEISFSRFLKSSDGAALEPQIRLEILSNFPHQPLERKLPDQQLRTLLVLTDFSQSHGSWPETVRLLHSAGCRSRLTSCLCGQLLPWSLSSG